MFPLSELQMTWLLVKIFSEVYMEHKMTFQKRAYEWLEELILSETAQNIPSKICILLDTRE